jgi:heat shock protein 4
MSVAGIDIGAATSCVAVARKRGVDVLLNKESKRETPTLVSFGPKQRQLGTDAVGALSVNPRNTVAGLKRLVGARWATFQEAAKKLPYEVVEGKDGGVAVAVDYCGERATFSPEQLLAAVLVDEKAVAAADGSSITDCVMTVPARWAQAERRVALAAAEIAGVSCLRLLHETTAAALAYGIYKTDLPDDTAPLRVAFVDAGAEAVQVSVVAYSKGTLKVLSHAWDAAAGGDAYDDALFEHWATAFDAKYKVDVRSSPRSSFRLRLACEKLKKLLSSIPDAVINVEGLAPDVDATGSMTRAEYEALTAGVAARAQAPMAAALAKASLTPADIASVEVIGGASRAPALLAAVEAAFGRPPSRTLNAKEAVARGAALACAMLSPIFRVREFEVIDSFPFGVAFSWDRDGARTSSVLFEAGGPLPSAKILTFLRDEQFTVDAAYTDESELADGAPRGVGSWSVGPPLVTPLRPAGDKARLKVKVKLNLHGIVQVEYVQQVEEEPVVEAEPAAAASAADGGDAAMADADGATAAAAAAGDGAAAAAAAAPMDADAPPAAPKAARVKKHTVAFDPAPTRYDAATMTALCEAELQMELTAKQRAEVDEAKNGLEAYIFATRSALADAWHAYASDAERDALSKALEAAEDWLYEEGEDTTRAAYAGKLAELHALGDRVAARADAATAGPAAAAELRAACAAIKAALGDADHAHIAEADRARAVAEAEAAVTWATEKEAAAKAAPKTADPVLTAGDAAKRLATVRRVCDPVLATPKPFFEPEPVKADDPPPAAGGECPAGDAPMEADAAGDEAKSMADDLD